MWLVFISGCDCYYEASGVLIDQESGLPIEGVMISLYSSQTNVTPKLEAETAADGSFTVNKITRRCEDLVWYFDREDYKNSTFQLADKSYNTLYLKPVSGMDMAFF